MARWNHPTKNRMRDLALQFSGTSSAALLVPGKELRCIKQGLQTGLFDRQTTIICMEKDPQIASHIRKKLEQMGFKNLYLHTDDASKLTSRQMEKVLKGKKIDFAFLDFCNTLNEETAFWLAEECSSLFEAGTKVSFTFALRTLNQNHKYLEKIETEKIYPCLRIDPSIIDYEARFSTYKDDPKTTIVGTWLAMAGNYSFDFLGVDGYNTNHFPMLLVRTKITGNKPIIEKKHFWNLIHDVVSESPKKGTVAEKLGCHFLMPKDLKDKLVREAKQGIRPPWLSPASWAWHPVNPNSRKAA